MTNIYYIVKHRKDSYSLDGVFYDPQEALDAVNESYQRALALGYDNRDNPWAIYRIEFSADYDADGIYLGSSRSERLWRMVEFSDINGKFIMDI